MPVSHATVSEAEAGQRLDKWFMTRFPGLPRSMLQKILRTGQVRLDGKRAKVNDRIAAGQDIRIPPLPDDVSVFKPRVAGKRELEALQQMTMYEDNALLVLNKPPGLAVQGGSKIKNSIDAMLGAMEKDGYRPKLVHRLDKDTSGLLVVAKTEKTVQALGRAFKNRDVHKTYWAVCVGVPVPHEGTVKAPLAKGGAAGKEKVGIDEKNGKMAITDYEVLDHAGREAALVAFEPETGRMHQIRVHAADVLGTPILGDGKYAGAAAHVDGMSDKLHLHARRLEFNHPQTGKPLTFTAAPAGHMKETIKRFGFVTS